MGCKRDLVWVQALHPKSGKKVEFQATSLLDAKIRNKSLTNWREVLR